jgi:hypothetical protein
VVQAVEAARTVEDHVITDPREADVGSILGFGFAPFTGGTLSYIDFMGTRSSSSSATSSRPNTARASPRRNCWKTWRRGRDLLRPLPAEEAGGGVTVVIARSAATKQSTLASLHYGLLRFARNDEPSTRAGSPIRPLFCENRFHCASGQKIEPESTTMHRKAKCFKNLLDHQSPDRSILGRATIRNSAYCPAAI